MKIELGKTAKFGKTITESDVCNFAGLVGDFNAIHVNEVEAKKSIFKGRIAHGFLVGSFISTVIGMYLPGPGTVYMSQTMNFKRPVKLNDTITAKVTVVEIINHEKGIYRLETLVVNQNEEVVIDGEAVVKYSE